MGGERREVGGGGMWMWGGRCHIDYLVDSCLSFGGALALARITIFYLVDIGLFLIDSWHSMHLFLEIDSLTQSIYCMYMNGHIIISFTPCHAMHFLGSCNFVT